MTTPRLVALLFLLAGHAVAKPSAQGGSPVPVAAGLANDAPVGLADDAPVSLADDVPVGLAGVAEAAAEDDAMQDVGAGAAGALGAVGEIRPPPAPQEQQQQQQEPVNTNEEPCLAQGGLCVRADECPEGSLNPQRGLCPSQRDQGVECCHGLSVQERRCSARGGICRPRRSCGRALWDSKATDCNSEEVCCILV